MTRQLVVSILALVGCSFEEKTPIGGSLEVTGRAYEFPSRAEVSTGITISATALLPPPKITTDGPTYKLDDVPENSVFQILAAAPPTHLATFSNIIEVIDEDLANVDVPVTSEAYLTTLTTAFNVTRKPENGILFIRLADGSGVARPGIAAPNIVLSGSPAAKGPFFLDATMMPAPALTATSSSGYAVFFEVAPSSIGLAAAAPNATVTLDMPASPINANAVTITNVKVTDGAPMPLPTNVSYSRDVFPIFGPPPGRGCVACHSSDGQGRKLGNLALNQPNPAYNELKDTATTLNAQRVNLLNPEASLLLTKPLLETPANHQNATFATALDKDYLKILVWIREGAKDN